MAIIQQLHCYLWVCWELGWAACSPSSGCPQAGAASSLPWGSLSTEQRQCLSCKGQVNGDKYPLPSLTGSQDIHLMNLIIDFVH